MCIKAVDRFLFVFKSVADSYKTQEICDKIIPNAPFVLKSCLGGHRTQERCDEVVDDFLPALKFVSDWFLTDKMIKKLHNVLFADDGIPFFDEDSGNIPFLAIKWVFLV